MFSRLTISQRLVIIATTIGFLTLMAVILVAFASTNQLLLSQSLQGFATQNEFVATALDRELQAVIATVKAVADRMTIVANQPAPILRKTIHDSATTSHAYSSIIRFTLYRPGQPLTVFDYEDLRNPPFPRMLKLEQDNWLITAFETQQTVWHIPASTQFSHPSEAFVSIAIPYVMPSGKRGLLAADIPLQTLHHVFHEHPLQVPTSSGSNATYSLIVDTQENVIAAFRLNSTAVNPLSSRGMETVLNAVTQLEAASQPVIFDDPFYHHQAFALSSDMPHTDWQVVTVFPEAALPSFPYRTLAQVLFVAFVGLVITAYVIRRYSRRVITKPLARLSTAAQEIGAGDMRYHIGQQSRSDEVGRMARALADMKTNLSRSYEELARWSRSLEKRVAQRTRELELAQQQAQTTAAELQATFDASLSVVSEHQLQPILQTFTLSILKLLKASYCGVWLLNSTETNLRLVESTSPQKNSLNMSVSIFEGLVGQTVREARPQRVDDYANWQNRLRLIDDNDMQRAMAVPMIIASKVIGVVIVGRKYEDAPFNENDQRLLTLFANIVSPAVRNAQLFVQRDVARREAERANQIKTRFLASVTHELRTPLNLVINNVDFMRIGEFGPVTGEQITRLNQAIRSAEHLLYLINDLLDISKIEAGEMQLFMQNSDVYQIIEDALDAAMIQLEKDEKPRMLVISADIPEGLPTVPMDARRIRQVLMNLLSNAVKFTPEGEVKLIVKLLENHIQFTVTDTGIGIPEEELRVLFEPFERTQRAKQMGIEGTGLGLPISRYMVEQHGGEMQVETTVGKGSRFTFTLPLQQRTQDKRTTVEQMAVILGQNIE